MRKWVRSCVIGVFLINVEAWADSPSFDCNKARLPAEIVICKTPRLAELDSLIAVVMAFSGRPAVVPRLT